MPAADAMQRLLEDPQAAAAWGVAAGLTEPSAAHRAFTTLAGLGVPFDLLGTVADELARLLPEAADADRVLAAVERFFAALRSPLSTAALCERDPRALETLVRIFATSPYLAEIVIADPESWEQVRLGQGRPQQREAVAAALRAEVEAVTDPADVMRALRRFKRRETLRIAYGDIVGGQRLETVATQISHLADAIVGEAVRSAVARLERQRGIPRGPGGERATLAAIALGKLGGAELNYSSDIDLVFVYSAEGRAEGAKPCPNQEFFERAVQEAVRLLTEPTELGIAYRVDLRLRPHGGVGPAVLALEPTLNHYDQFGRTWERQAWVKARVVGGDETLGARLLAELEPWVYRRWLSGADISGIKALKRRIEHRAEREGTDQRNLKTGRGGIRDIEFTIQFLQLLSGGDLPQVRTGATLEAIRRLAAAGALTDQEREILERTYTLLRTVEHRLQILYDRQTHDLPVEPGEFARLAMRCGYGPGPAAAGRLRADLDAATDLNRRILDHLLHDAFPDDGPPEPEVDLVLDPDPPASLVHDVLARHGFRDVPAAHHALTSLGEEQVRFLSTRRCRHFLAAIAPRLLTAIGRTPDPDATLANLGRVGDSLGGKGVLWELFSFNPASLDLTVRLCSSSPFLSGLLVSNPGMLDELLDSLLLEHLPDEPALTVALDELCGNAADIAPMLHAFKASQQLRVGVRDILGKLVATEVTVALTTIADVLLRKVVAHEEARIVERFGEPIAGEGDTVGVRAGPVVLAMGKCGGREMNYASDIDAVFLYDHEGTTFSPRRGRRSLEGTTNAHFFGELAQRTMRVFNTFTVQGRLYELDSRLRPSGRSGPAALALAGLEGYFAPAGPAAVWERQALVKARVVVGARPAAARAMQIVHRAAYERRWSAAEVETIRAMRFRMEEGARPTNLKRGPGGVVDIEFIAQVLQLMHGGENPALRTPETLAALDRLHAAGHLDAEDHRFLSRAYQTLRSIEGRLRLLDATARHDFPADAAEQRKLAHLLGAPDPDALVTEVQALTARVRTTFERIFDRTADTSP